MIRLGQEANTLFYNDNQIGLTVLIFGDIDEKVDMIGHKDKTANRNPTSKISRETFGDNI